MLMIANIYIYIYYNIIICDLDNRIIGLWIHGWYIEQMCTTGRAYLWQMMITAAAKIGEHGSKCSKFNKK